MMTMLTNDRLRLERFQWNEVLECLLMLQSVQEFWYFDFWNRIFFHQLWRWSWNFRLSWVHRISMQLVNRLQHHKTSLKNSRRLEQKFHGEQGRRERRGWWGVIWSFLNILIAYEKRRSTGFFFVFFFFFFF